ncbi:MAG: tetratricopeptide repeat protein, partial [Gemmatimonadales bacterium]
MPRALTSPTAALIGAALLSTLTACGPKKGGTDSASATVTASASATPTAEWNASPVALSTTSAEAKDLYLKGRKLAEELRLHDGRQLFEQAAAKDPSFAMAHYQLAITSATAKDFFEHMNEAVALSDKATDGERLMILNLQAGGNAQPKQAREYAEELVSKYPNDERAHFLLGNAYFGQQDFDKAIEQYKKAIEINAQFSGAYNSLGYAYRPIEKYADAETAFKKYIELIPNDPNPYDSYAELLMKTGRFDESIAQYQRALSVDPHFSNAFIGIATDLMLQGKHDQAAAQAQKLYDKARDDGDKR